MADWINGNYPGAAGVSPWTSTVTIYTNDLQAGTECNVVKLVDDTKLGGKAVKRR